VVWRAHLLDCDQPRLHFPHERGDHDPVDHHWPPRVPRRVRQVQQRQIQPLQVWGGQRLPALQGLAGLDAGRGLEHGAQPAPPLPLGRRKRPRSRELFKKLKAVLSGVAVVIGTRARAYLGMAHVLSAERHPHIPLKTIHARVGLSGTLADMCLLVRCLDSLRLFLRFMPLCLCPCLVVHLRWSTTWESYAR